MLRVNDWVQESVCCFSKIWNNSGLHQNSSFAIYKASLCFLSLQRAVFRAECIVTECDNH